MIPFIIPAIIIHHIMALHPLHSPRLLPGEAAGGVGGGGDGAAPRWSVGGAAGGYEVGEFSDEGLVAIICLVFAILSSP